MNSTVLGQMKLPAWKGDLEDDCSLEVGDFIAHVELMVDCIQCRQRDEKGDPWGKWEMQMWHMSVGRGRETIFHAGEYAGTITSGELARAIAETIIRLAIEDCPECKGMGDIQTDAGTQTCGWCLGTGVKRCLSEKATKSASATRASGKAESLQ